MPTAHLLRHLRFRRGVTWDQIPQFGPKSHNPSLGDGHLRDTQLACIAAGLHYPRLSDLDWLYQRSVRMAPDDQIDARHLLCQTLVNLETDVGKRNHKVHLRFKKLHLLLCRLHHIYDLHAVYSITSRQSAETIGSESEHTDFQSRTFQDHMVLQAGHRWCS